MTVTYKVFQMGYSEIVMYSSLQTCIETLADLDSKSHGRSNIDVKGNSKCSILFGLYRLFQIQIRLAIFLNQNVCAPTSHVCIYMYSFGNTPCSYFETLLHPIPAYIMIRLGKEVEKIYFTHVAVQ